MLCKKGALQIRTTRYPLIEHFEHKQCTRCLRYGIKKMDCKCCPNCLQFCGNGNCEAPKAQKCMKCGGDHIASTCTEQPRCYLSGRTESLAMKGTNHRALTERCHFRIQKEQEKRRYRCYEPIEVTDIKPAENSANTKEPPAATAPITQ